MLDKAVHFCSRAKEANHETNFLFQRMGIGRGIHSPDNASKDLLRHIVGVLEMSGRREHDFVTIVESVLITLWCLNKQIHIME